MQHVIKRIDELVKETDQTKALWHILMCIRLAAVDDWKVMQEIVDEVYEKMKEHDEDDRDNPQYYEGFSDGLDHVLGIFQEKTGLIPMKDDL